MDTHIHTNLTHTEMKAALPEHRFLVFYCPPLPHEFIQTVIQTQFLHYTASISMIISHAWEKHIKTAPDWELFLSNIPIGSLIILHDHYCLQKLCLLSCQQ